MLTREATGANFLVFDLTRLCGSKIGCYNQPNTMMIAWLHYITCCYDLIRVKPLLLVKADILSLPLDGATR